MSGRPPFPGGAAEEKLRRHRHEQPAGLEELRPEVPRGLDEVVRTMMAKDPGDRFPTPGAAAAALGPFAQPGDCSSHYVLELDEGLAGLDPAQATVDLPPPPGDNEGAPAGG